MARLVKKQQATGDSQNSQVKFKAKTLRLADTGSPSRLHQASTSNPDTTGYSVEEREDSMIIEVEETHYRGYQGGVHSPSQSAISLLSGTGFAAIKSEFHVLIH